MSIPKKPGKRESQVVDFPARSEASSQSGVDEVKMLKLISSSIGLHAARARQNPQMREKLEQLARYILDLRNKAKSKKSMSGSDSLSEEDLLSLLPDTPDGFGTIMESFNNPELTKEEVRKKTGQEEQALSHTEEDLLSLLPDTPGESGTIMESFNNHESTKEEVRKNAGQEEQDPLSLLPDEHRDVDAKRKQTFWNLIDNYLDSESSIDDLRTLVNNFMGELKLQADSNSKKIVDVQKAINGAVNSSNKSSSLGLEDTHQTTQQQNAIQRDESYEEKLNKIAQNFVSIAPQQVEDQIAPHDKKSPQTEDDDLTKFIDEYIAKSDEDQIASHDKKSSQTEDDDLTKFIDEYIAKPDHEVKKPTQPNDKKDLRRAGWRRGG